jgi:hypothetical protein
MSNPLTDVITGGFSSVLSGIGDVIGRFVTDPNAKLQAQVELTKVATDYQVQVLLAEKDLAVQQASVIVAEAKSESWIARNWRPLTMLSFVFIIDYNYILAPIFTLHSLPIVPDMWELIKIGLGGYVVGRSAEKIVPKMMEAMKK